MVGGDGADLGFVFRAPNGCWRRSRGEGPGHTTRVSLYAFVHMYHPAAHAAKPSLAFVNKRREGFNTTRPTTSSPVTDDENQKYLKRAKQHRDEFSRGDRGARVVPVQRLL